MIYIHKNVRVVNNRHKTES